jgi:hypothetical protein
LVTIAGFEPQVEAKKEAKSAQNNGKDFPRSFYPVAPRLCRVSQSKGGKIVMREHRCGYLRA